MTSKPSKPSKPSKFNIRLHVAVYISPENIDQFFDAFKPAYDQAFAEPECLRFEVYKSRQNPGEIRWVEDWSKSLEWFLKEQITKSYYKEYLKITEPMFIKPREVRILERLGPDVFRLSSPP
ncbi:hypothetical protein F4803DRAFT_569999 [Xylaria telfairii]|nr:hypothetical protein F4803DRAFT_569999 [Xylaria telfairii]